MARKTKTRFRVTGKFGPRCTEATIIIDRATGLFELRPLRSRKAFEIPLDKVAAIMFWKWMDQLAAERKAEKARKRAERGVKERRSRRGK